ncbi:MAG: hypothetical protein LC798_17085 [Chloroflexi bacterium]|nr:hypothetical protein [Chloroflexota bacterium]
MAYEATEVAVDRSQGEIRRMLVDHAAQSFSFGEGQADGTVWAIVEFVHAGQRVRIQVPHKPVNEAAFRAKVQRAQTRTPAQIRADLQEQEARRIWRVMFHGMKARLVAVQEGVETLEQAFMAHLVDPVTNRTLWDQAKELIAGGAMRTGGAGMAIGPPALGPGPVLVEDDDEVVLGEVVG